MDPVGRSEPTTSGFWDQVVRVDIDPQDASRRHGAETFQVTLRIVRSEYRDAILADNTGALLQQTSADGWPENADGPPAVLIVTSALPDAGDTTDLLFGRLVSLTVNLRPRPRIGIVFTDFERVMAAADGHRPEQPGRLDARATPLARAVRPAGVAAVVRAVVAGRRPVHDAMRTLANVGRRTPRWSPFRAPADIAVFAVGPRGFFTHDFSANHDLMTGRPLRTCAGSVLTRPFDPPTFSGFPKAASDLPGWLPYMTADPLLWAATGMPSILALRPADISSAA
jgi:hypothetical protein